MLLKNGLECKLKKLWGDVLQGESFWATDERELTLITSCGYAVVGSATKMKTPIEVDEIDWAAVDVLTVEFGYKSHIPKLIRAFYEGEIDQDRLETLVDLLVDALPDHDGDRFLPAAPYIMLCLLPVLSDDTDPAARYWILSEFMYACAEARVGRQTTNSLANAGKTLAVIEQGFPEYLRLFQAHPELRAVVSGIWTAFPKRIGEYLPLLLEEYRQNIDPYVRAELMELLSRISADIRNWREMVMNAVGSDSPMPLRFVAAGQMVRLDGDRSPAEVLGVLASTPQGEVQWPRVAMADGRLFNYSWSGSLQNALDSLSPDRQMNLLLRRLVVDKEFPYSIAPLLLEAVYGERYMVRSTGASYEEPIKIYLFEWIGPERSRELELRPDGPDWLGALISAERLWRETYRTVPGVRELKTNLFSLFGLPADRAGLIQLWESVHGITFS
jgi:hypothetical protein